MQRSWGGEFRGPHSPVVVKNQGKNGGKGSQLTRELWLCPGKNNREDQVRAPTPHPHKAPCIFRVQRGDSNILSSRNMFQQSQKNPSCSGVFCISRQCSFTINFLKGFFLDLQRIPPPQERPHHADSPHYKKEESHHMWIKGLP